MQRFEFKVIPAPRRGEKSRGAKTTEDRFALALTNLMNRLGAEGWDYVRADVLPCDERSGLTGTKTSFQNMLVFRRALPAAAAAPQAEAEPKPALPVLVADAAEPAPQPLPALRLGAAEPPSGPSNPIGPAKPELAAE